MMTAVTTPTARMITPEGTMAICPPAVSSLGQAWNGLFLAQRLDRDQAVAYPPVDHHLLSVQQTGATTLTRRIGAETQRGRASAGSVSIIAAGQGSSWEWSGPAGRIDLYLDAALVENLARDAGESESAQMEILNSFAVRDFTIEQVARGLLRELQSPAIASRLYVQSLSQLLGVHLLRNHSSMGAIAVTRKGGLTPFALRRVREFIESHLADDVSLNDMAEAAGLSNFHFCRSFKQSTGMTPHRYQLHRRIERAKELLCDRSIPLATLAAAVGFSSQSHFSTAFRKLVGTTPHRYRSEL